MTDTVRPGGVDRVGDLGVVFRVGGVGGDLRVEIPSVVEVLFHLFGRHLHFRWVEILGCLG